ncbi:tRNA pseudouridine(55) synthase TruB [Facilibium subflavum]|uniref:tRNA pseudouridine(55) synthase TruB n=1 Tax=Facilibium subflavum TaxID=2219058 RepID=UPI000E649561|nr:tRNA pseudouridine(55) synthase TruB [Facilibium subflavum]
MARKRKGIAINGIIVVDKPKGASSNHVLQQVKRLFNAQKAGHTGSLDPMATGVLPICFGQATRISQYLLDADKAYIATIQLGKTTDTGDAEGQILTQESPPLLDMQELQNLLDLFIGEIQQTPPMYSALKHQGQPLYKLARKGIEITRPPRLIHIYQLDCMGYDSENHTINVYVKCSKGTYIRALAIDIGEKIGCGAHLSALKRVQCGLLTDKEMVSLEKLNALSSQQMLQYIYSSEYPFTDCPIFTIPKDEIDIFYRTGKLMNTQKLHGIVRLYDENAQFIAIANFDQGQLIKKQFFLQGIMEHDQKNVQH